MSCSSKLGPAGREALKRAFKFSLLTAMQPPLSSFSQLKTLNVLNLTVRGSWVSFMSFLCTPVVGYLRVYLRTGTRHGAVVAALGCVVRQDQSLPSP